MTLDMVINYEINNIMLFPQPTHNNCLPTSVSQLSRLRRFGMTIGHRLVEATDVAMAVPRELRNSIHMLVV